MTGLGLPPRRTARAFLLLEVMLAVGIFSVGVIGLGYCVNNCLNAESARDDNQRARLALENRMAEVEAGAVAAAGEKKREELQGEFSGMILTQTRKPLKLKDDKQKPIDGITEVRLEVTWESGGEKQAKELMFYVYGNR